MASSSFEAVSSSSDMTNDSVSESLIRSATELGPKGVAEFNRLIDQRVNAAKTAAEEPNDDAFNFVDAADEREDVAEARRLAQRLSVELHYGEADHLEMAYAKVRRRALLESDIDSQVQPFADAMRQTELDEVLGIAQNAKEIVVDIQDIGKKKDTSVVKPTEMIASILEVFKRMCLHVTLNMKPKGNVMETLTRFQGLREERLTKLKTFEMDPAEEILREGFKLLEKSRECASNELDAVMKLIEQVEEANYLPFFFEEKRQIEEMIKGEMNELGDLKKECEGDLASAEKLEAELNDKHHQCTDFHLKQMASFDKKLERNRREQEELRRRLRELEESEKDLEEKKAVEKESQGNAARCVKKGVESVRQESEKIRDLMSKAEASLDIMEKTRGLGILVFDSAIFREQELQKALNERKTKALRDDRIALMESAVARRLAGKDHESNAQDMKEEIERLSEDMTVKAKRGNKQAVAKIQKDLDEQKALLLDEKEKMNESKREFNALLAQIAEVEKGMDDDDPVLQTTIEDLYRERQEAITEFWEQAKTDKQMQSIPGWSLQ